ncbi:hypothetical protein FHW16_002601 [Phyllobacterium myrsinacearum]|uniref:Uncharacterized protein n=1 Tax=Phyllobacterium myrsinacearum TaxID=28101 RepID=A0A839EFF7_9HYPH|nr:hypothetical protein [Phyllobacterium myrsinacearum]
MSPRSNHAQRASPAEGGSAGSPSNRENVFSGFEWLCLPASPTFALMALLATSTDNANMICSATQTASPFSGMVVMYVLMSVFHSAPWFRLFARRRNSSARPL